MGGWGSGRHSGRPTADMSKKIDLAWMIRSGRATPGQWISGALSWNCGGLPAGSVSYVANMEDHDAAYLQLSFWRGTGNDKEHVQQTVRLVYTEPNYGGRRWWMVCPFKGIRVAKLYLPNGGDRFASRTAWRLAYNSQRVAHRDRPFEKALPLAAQAWLPARMGMMDSKAEKHVAADLRPPFRAL